MKNSVLYVVSTPIGNLQDITFRALDVLRNVDLIACEDTRKSRILLEHCEISTKLMSLHRFSESRKTQVILERLQQGEAVAVITDAGTPAISDPGSRLVRAALDAGFTVTPIPGPSSITAALSVSGMDCSCFVYLGFAPRTNEQRRLFFERIRQEQRTSLFFETAKRIQATLQIAEEILGDRRLVLSRELTKLHEEIIPGTAASILSRLENRASVKGEIVVAVEGGTRTGPQIDVREAVKLLIAEGFSGRRLAAEAHERFGLRKSDAYEVFLTLKDANADSEQKS
ncbi:MAG: 16S rRNA (cytidine(1402)-2'-O)-methyltransferase [Desulfomonilaceae bacterium]